MGEFFGGRAMEARRIEYDLPETENASEEIKELIRKKPFIREALTDLWKTDRRVTFRHSIETARLASLVSEELGLNSEERDLLIGSSLVHDVGKIFVDKGVLDKPEKLTEEEIKEMREHVRKGFLYLKEKGVEKEADIMAGHHQHKNYPRDPKNDRRQSNVIYLDERRRGERRKNDPQIEKYARIISILDIFESMASTDRPYNKNREILPKRKEELKNFNRPDELRIIDFLESREKGEQEERGKLVAFPLKKF